MSKLLSPINLKGVNLRNRMVISPMCQYSAVDGFANDWHLVHLGSRAVGGAGLIIQEATAVSPEGRITPADLGLYHPEHVEKLKQIATFVIQQGSVPGIQLAHAGRKACCAEPWKGGRQITRQNGGWSTLSSSAVPFFPEDELPVSLDAAGIRKVVADFAAAASRAREAGFQVLDIHAAHGYLVHQFLSPLSNHRSDDYGGSFENRIRLLMEILDGVKSSWPHHLPMFVRISATDWAADGWNPDEAVRLSVILKQQGVDLIDCSSGGLLPDVKIPVGPGFQVKFAERIRKEAGIFTSAVGLITDPHQAEEILERGAADLIMFGRESLREPYFPLKAATELKDEIEWPPQYIRAKP